MCGPLALPIALIAAGTGAKYFGEKKAAKAQNNTYNAERVRQDDLTAQQNTRFQDSVNGAKSLTDSDAIAKAAGARETTLAGAIAPQPTAASYLPGSSSAPSIVATASDKASAGSAVTSSNLARTLAALGGATDQMQGLGTSISRNNSQIGQLGSFKAGSAGVLSAEMRAAAHKGQFLRTAGGLAQTIGKAWLGGSFGSVGASPGGTLGSDLGLKGTQAFSHVSPGII